MTTDNDTMVPDRMVMAELSISAMTLWRWERDPALSFPPKIQIRNRNYRSRKALEAFKERMFSEAARAPRRFIEQPRRERVRLRSA